MGEDSSGRKWRCDYSEEIHRKPKSVRDIKRWKLPSDRIVLLRLTIDGEEEWNKAMKDMLQWPRWYSVGRRLEGGSGIGWMSGRTCDSRSRTRHRLLGRHLLAWKSGAGETGSGQISQDSWSRSYVDQIKVQQITDNEFLYHLHHIDFR